MKYDRNEIVAGIFVLVCIFLLLALIFKVGNFKESMQPKKEIIVRFSHARGIKNNSPIYYAGVQSGKVSNLEIDEKDNVYITLQLEKGISIRKDSIVKIGSSVMGEAYIDIVPGAGEVVESGETITGSDAGIAQQIEDVITSIQDLVKSDKITSSLDNLDKTLENMAIISGTFAKDKDKFESIISNINEITQSLNENLGEIMDKMNTVLSNIAEITDAEQAEKIDKITENLVKVTRDADNILAENRKSIKAITTNIESITDNLYILSADLKRNPWKVIWKSKEKDVEKYALQDAIIRLKEAEKNLIILNENNERISDKELEEIRALIQNLKTIQKSAEEIPSQSKSRKSKRKPFGK